MFYKFSVQIPDQQVRNAYLTQVHKNIDTGYLTVPKKYISMLVEIN
jgi:hypothetical protein